MRKIILLFEIIIAIIIILAIVNNASTIKLIFNQNNSSNDTITNINITQNPQLTIQEDNLTIPSNDYVINKINWSYYPNLQTGYVYKAYISEPNDVINHKFIEVQIITEIKNEENKTDVLKQMASVAREARKIYGPNSGINIIGNNKGIFEYMVSMLPYDDQVIGYG